MLNRLRLCSLYVTCLSADSALQVRLQGAPLVLMCQCCVGKLPASCQYRNEVALSPSS